MEAARFAAIEDDRLPVYSKSNRLVSMQAHEGIAPSVKGHLHIGFVPVRLAGTLRKGERAQRLVPRDFWLEEWEKQAIVGRWHKC